MRFGAPQATCRVIASTLLILNATLLFIQSVQAQEAPATVGSVFRLKNSGGCGTGFTTSNGPFLYTNAHIARTLCPNGACSVTLGNGSKEETIHFTVVRLFPVLDVAALLPAQPIEGMIKGTRPPSVGDAVTMIGYPGCGPRVVSKGSITAIDPLHFDSTAIGASGSSGSPVLSGDGALIGIAHRSGSFLAALYDKFFGGEFELRGARADTLAIVMSLPEIEGLHKEGALLFDLYRSHLINNPRSLRTMLTSVEFINGVHSLQERLAEISDDQELLRAASLLDQYPGAWSKKDTSPPTSTFGKQIELLVFAANLEQYGPHQQGITRIDPTSFREHLIRSGRDQEQIQALTDLLAVALKQNFPGLLVTWIVMGVSAAAIALLTLLIFSASLGYTYASAKGGRFRRAAVTLLVAVAAWPLSLLVFRLKKGRRGL